MYISAFDGAHVSLPKYSDSYQSVKNLAPVIECLKPQGGRADQNTLRWQFGLRAYSNKNQSHEISNSGLSSKLSGDPNNLGGDIRLRTNFASKPNPSEGELSVNDDPMEGMVELNGGGYNLAKFVAVDPDNQAEIHALMTKQARLDYRRSQKSSMNSTSKV